MTNSDKGRYIPFRHYRDIVGCPRRLQRRKDKKVVLDKSASVRFCVSVGVALGAMFGMSSAVRADVVLLYNPTADSYVDSYYPTTNYGLSPYLEVSGGPLPGSEIRHSFLKFDLSNYTGPIDGATLVLYGQHINLGGANGSEPDTAWGVPDNSWTQLGLDWDNQPALGPEQGTTTVTGTLGYYDWDVTSFVQSISSSTSRIVSLAVTEALVPDNASGYDIFGSGHPGPPDPPTWPAPELLISTP
jgi:hypothetical protein